MRHARERVRLALELVADPTVDMDTVDADDMLRHIWRIAHRVYGISLGNDFYSVHRVGDPRNCVWLTTRLDQAQDIARWWPGYSVTVTAVSAVDRYPERWLAMGLALHWEPPEKK